MVITESLDARGCRLVITPPPSRSLVGRLQRFLASLRGGSSMLEELEAQQQVLTQTHEDLKRAESSFRDTLEALPAGVALHRSDGLLYSNAPFREMLALEAGGLLWEALPDEARGVLEGALELAGEPALLRTDADKALEVTGLPGPVIEGQQTTLLFLRDVTAQQALEKQLAIQDRMVAVGTLAAGAAHELNNPLTYVLGNIDQAHELLLGAAAGAEVDLGELAAMLADALDGVERIRRTVHDLQHFSRVRKREIGPVDLVRVIEHALRLSSHTLKHRAVVERDLAPCPQVTGDEDQLVQVLVNLLVNAAQAMDPASGRDGRVRLVLRADPEQQRVSLRVEDNGRGIPKKLQRQIFDPFFTTRRHTGTGLGLAITHRLITDMGGDIAVESEEGRGTAFLITLPVSEQPAVAAAVDAPTPLPDGLLVLVIDDEALVRSSLRNMLAGHEVREAASGGEALTLLRDGLEPDVILCDLLMEEMNGLEFFEALVRRGGHHHQRLLFLSGGLFSPQMLTLLANTGRPLLQKPVTRTRYRYQLRPHQEPRSVYHHIPNTLSHRQHLLHTQNHNQHQSKRNPLQVFPLHKAPGHHPNNKQHHQRRDHRYHTHWLLLG